VSDNLFERLFELFQSPGPINWKLAHEVTGSLAGHQEPIDPELAEEYQELSLAAQLRLAPHAPFDVSAGRLPDPVDRAGWAAANEQSFAYLIAPLADKLTPGIASTGPLSAMLGPMGPALLGMQAGTMVGFMSHRVLGQFDTGVPALDARAASLVVPNVEDFAVEHSIDAHQVRLWAALHEIGSHAVLAVAWVGGHLRELLGEFFEGLEFDPSGLLEQLGSLQEPADFERLVAGSEELPALLGRKDQPTEVGRLQGALGFLEGYVDHLAGRAALEVLPDLGRIDEAHSRRRAEPTQVEQMLHQLVGLDLQRSRATDAARFCSEVSRRWGEEPLDGIWQGPERLPTVDELTDPVGWAARVLLDE
jgi:putative hydrolase